MITITLYISPHCALLYTQSQNVNLYNHSQLNKHLQIKNAKSEIKTAFPNGFFESTTAYKSNKVASLQQRNIVI